MTFLKELLDDFNETRVKYARNFRPPVEFESAMRALALYVAAVQEYIKLELPDHLIDEQIETPEMLAKPILFFSSPCVLACDKRCESAFGSEGRPRLIRAPDGTYVVYAQEDDEDDGDIKDPDDFVYLADSELGVAPIDPGTTEGGDRKPRTPEERLNRWCARACERSVIVEYGKPIELKDFSQRLYNIAPHKR